MQVQVRLYGRLAEAAGWRRREVLVAEPATVLDLLRQCAALAPGLAAYLPPDPAADLPDYLLVLVGDAEAAAGSRLAPGATVILALPPSGGEGVT